MMWMTAGYVLSVIDAGLEWERPWEEIPQQGEIGELLVSSVNLY